MKNKPNKLVEREIRDWMRANNLKTIENPLVSLEILLELATMLELTEEDIEAFEKIKRYLTWLKEQNG